LEAWLKEHRPRYHEGLRPGASADDLAALEKALGFPLPEELRTWLGWHDAQSPDLMGAFRDSFALMSAREIAEAHADLVSEPEPGWRREWVPSLDAGQGDYVCLDTATAGHPIREVWRGRTDHPIVAASLAEWAADLLADVEAGRYVEDPERGEFVR